MAIWAVSSHETVQLQSTWELWRPERSVWLDEGLKTIKSRLLSQVTTHTYLRSEEGHNAIGRRSFWPD
ncbi:hypothetical protein HYQ46_012610 [Verticillium longisporum]|nr:hypothetical protein HYQ46_012610 [Verticillium longisporum]